MFGILHYNSPQHKLDAVEQQYNAIRQYIKTPSLGLSDKQLDTVEQQHSSIQFNKPTSLGLSDQQVSSWLHFLNIC